MQNFVFSSYDFLFYIDENQVLIDDFLFYLGRWKKGIVWTKDGQKVGKMLSVHERLIERLEYLLICFGKYLCASKERKNLLT